MDEASTITSNTTGVDYNNYDDHEFDDAMPSLLVFEPCNGAVEEVPGGVICIVRLAGEGVLVVWSCR